MMTVMVVKSFMASFGMKMVLGQNVESMMVLNGGIIVKFQISLIN